MTKKCTLCKKEDQLIWIPEFTICNKCLVKGFWQVIDKSKIEDRK